MNNGSTIRDQQLRELFAIINTHLPHFHLELVCGNCGRPESEHAAHGDFCPDLYSEDQLFSTHQRFSPLRGTPPRTWTSSGAEGRGTLTLKGRFEVFPGSTVEGEIICDACQGYRTVQAEWSEQAGRPCEKCKGKGTI